MNKSRFNLSTSLIAALFFLLLSSHSLPLLGQGDGTAVCVPASPLVKVSQKPFDLWQDSTFIFDRVTLWQDALNVTDVFALQSGTLDGGPSEMDWFQRDKLREVLEDNAIEFGVIHAGLQGGACQKAKDACQAAYGSSTSGEFGDNLCDPYYLQVGINSANNLLKKVAHYVNDPFETPRGVDGTVDFLRLEGPLKRVTIGLANPDGDCNFSIDYAQDRLIEYMQVVQQELPEIRFHYGVNYLNWYSTESDTSPVDYPCARGFPTTPGCASQGPNCFGANADLRQVLDGFKTKLAASSPAVDIALIHADGEYSIHSPNADRLIGPCGWPSINSYDWWPKARQLVRQAHAMGYGFEKTFNAKDDDTICDCPGGVCSGGETVEECKVRVTNERVLAFIDEWKVAMEGDGLCHHVDVLQINQFGTQLAPLDLLPDSVPYTFENLVLEAEMEMNQ